MIFQMLSWWYTSGWLQSFHRIGTWLAGVDHAFSVRILIKTLFYPWHRIISVNKKTVNDRINSLMDNLLSRSVGFVVRLITLFTAGVLAASILAAGALMVVIWPLLPLAAVFFLIRGILA